MLCTMTPIGWALIFLAHGQLYPVTAKQCFSEQRQCEAAATSANLAFNLDGTQRYAYCVPQPQQGPKGPEKWQFPVAKSKVV